MPFCRRRFSAACRSRRTRKNLTRTFGRTPHPRTRNRAGYELAAGNADRTVSVLRRRDPENPSWGYICPMCGWEIDYDVEGEPDKPSDQNHGLSLTEARWNFHSFGTVAPWKIMENG